MPKPVGGDQRYMPGLDGLRALAVLAVIAFHLQFTWAPGGLLGVGIFFTLSGFLITSLLVEQWWRRGSIKLGEFWLRRARRLLPALFVMLAVVTAWITIDDRARLASLRGADGAAAGYFSNWYLIAMNQSYFSRFAPPAPLDHLWSLAVEEQFYLLWPILLILGLLLLRRLATAKAGGQLPDSSRRASSGGRPPESPRRASSGGRPPESPRTRAPRWFIVPTVALSLASVFEMAHLYTPGVDPTRVYEGTDTRAFGLLIGAVLALAWPAGRTVKPGWVVRVLLDAAGVVGLAVIGVLIWRVGEYSTFGYRGGLVLLSVATTAVVATTACPGTLVGLALGWRPLRWVGARSYGIYLWHYPVIVLTTPASSKPDLARAAIQVAVVVVIAALSWRFIEEPIRHGAIEKLWARARAAGSWTRADYGLGNLTTFGGLAATAGATSVLLVASVGLSGAVPTPAGSGSAGQPLAAGSAQLPVTRSVARAAKRTRQEANGKSAPGSAWPTSGPPQTSCRSVAHLGDSTSDGLVSASYLPNATDRIAARYEDVGVQSVLTDVSGARSVVEALPGQVNGYDAAKSIIRGGFSGCWVIALGTNDTADVAAGSTYSLMYRIKRMMAVTKGEPVMWVNLKSLLVSGPYAEANMLRWDQTLVKACAMYPNMRVYNWAAEVHRKWYISDGIHFTSLGYKYRAEDIANALGHAFPASGHSSGCLVPS